MIACHGAPMTVNHIDHLRQRFEAAQHSVTDDDRCSDDDVIMTSTVEARRWTTRARSLPLDSSETICHRLVSRGTQTSSALARYLTVTAAHNIGQDEAWLRRIDAMDLSFPVSRQSELRCFLADTLALAEHGGNVDGKQAAVSRPRTPQMKRRRWAACDLCLSDGPTATVDVDDQPLMALDDDPEEWTDDDDDETPSSMSAYDCTKRPVIARWTPGMYGTPETRSYFRFGCRTVSRHPAPNMPMIREDEQADDDDLAADNITTPNRRSSPPAEPPPSLRSLQMLLPRVHRTQHCSRAAVADVELASCCRRSVEMWTKHDPHLTSPTSTAPSLLDTLHKKYCANQYARRRAPSPPGCHGNIHLLDLATQRPSTDCSCDAVNDFVTQQTEMTEPVTGNRVTSSHRGDCDTTVGDGVETNDDNAHYSTTSSIDMTPSTLSTAGFDDDEDEDDDDEEEEEQEENCEVKDEEQQYKTATMFDDQPWKKRFCDFCHGELKV